MFYFSGPTTGSHFKATQRVERAPQNCGVITEAQFMKQKVKLLEELNNM